MTVSQKVKDKLQELPDQPGVYLMRGRSGRVIYVGKAASLRNRVRSYFRKSTRRSADPKLRSLINSVHDLETIPLRTEAEATLTESHLIKEYRPRYNVLLKDDKRFLLVRTRLSDPWPRFETCRIEKDDGSVYFGPYTHSDAARAAVDFVERRFGIRRCRPHVPDRETYRHCLNDIIRTCSAPCVGRIDQDAYRHRVEEACAFLRGERPDCLADLKEDMQDAAERRDFEQAAVLRDTLRLLHRAVKERARVRRAPAAQAERLKEGLRELQQVLDLSHPPHTIEAFDISNISGTMAVGSMVCSVDGQPRRNRYRLFRIRTQDHADDPRMMAEVVERRYRRLQDEQRPLPDLVLTDGGLTQVRAARRALDGLGLERLPAAGLAKRFEELYAPGDSLESPRRLPEDSPAREVVQVIRDEAHRFAVGYHRRLRARRIRESVLDDIPGIGRERKRALLEHFGSLRRLQQADADAIADVPGFGTTTARQVYAALHP